MIYLGKLEVKDPSRMMIWEAIRNSILCETIPDNNNVIDINEIASKFAGRNTDT